MDVGTPLSHNYYINTPTGEIYGLDHNVERFADPEIIMNLRAETDIPGLVLTGELFCNELLNKV
jgi:all-trans-retinol 13,14-reductase